MQWVDVLKEFPYQSDCIPIGKKDAKKLQLAVVRDKSYFSKDKTTRQAALKWLDCSASLNQNYKEFFLHALPGYLYIIPEVGRGLFLCISQVISYSNDISISADLYKDKKKFDRDVYVFVNSNVPDKPFFVTRRQLKSFFGRSPSEHVVKIILENLDITIKTPEKLLSVVTKSDLFDTEGDLIDPDNQHDLTLMEQTIEESIYINPETPIDVSSEEKNILKLISSIHSGKLKNKKRSEKPRELYIDKQLKVLLEHLREKLDPRAFAVIDPSILRSKIALLISENIKIQKKQTEDWYADETSLAVPENISEKSLIEMPNIPANNIESNSSNKGRDNLRNNNKAILNDQALNSEERGEITEKKEQGWLGFLSSSIGWRGGTRKYKRFYKSSLLTRKTQRGGSAIIEGSLISIGEKAAQLGKKFGLQHSERVGTKKTARMELINNPALKNLGEDERLDMISEYDALYDKVYFQAKGETFEAEFKENLARNLTEGEMHSSLSMASMSSATAAAVGWAYVVGGPAVSGLITNYASGSLTFAAIASSTTIAAALPVVVSATGAAIVAASVIAVVVTAVGGYQAGLSRAKQINEITKETVLSLTEAGVKTKNANINTKISLRLKNMVLLKGDLFKLNTTDAVKWMNRVGLVLSFLAAGASKILADRHVMAEKEKAKKKLEEEEKAAAEKKRAAAAAAAAAEKAAAEKKRAAAEAAQKEAEAEEAIRKSNSQRTLKQRGKNRLQSRRAREDSNPDVHRNGPLVPRGTTQQTGEERLRARRAREDSNPDVYRNGVLTPREAPEQTYRRRREAREAKQASMPESYGVITPQPNTPAAEEEEEAVGEDELENNVRSVGSQNNAGSVGSPLPNNNTGLSSELYKCGQGERFSVKDI